GLSPGGQKRADRAVGSGQRPGRRRRERTRRAAAGRFLLVVDLLGQCPDRGRCYRHRRSRHFRIERERTASVRWAWRSAQRPRLVSDNPRPGLLRRCDLDLAGCRGLHRGRRSRPGRVRGQGTNGRLTDGATRLAADPACTMYLLAYLAFSGFIYYVTLYFQNVQRWSALHTGLSWLL